MTVTNRVQPIFLMLALGVMDIGAGLVPGWELAQSPPKVAAEKAETGALGKGLQGARLLPGGGVADPGGKLAFFPNTMGGIDAVDLDSGKIAWSTKLSKRPLLATDGRLFVLQPAPGKTGAHVRVLALDTKDGKKVLESQPIALPEWAGLDTTYGRSFHQGARLDAQALYFAWEARAWYAGGAAPPPEVERAARKHASGVTRFDLETARTELLARDRISTFFPLMTDVARAKVGVRTLAIQDSPANNPQNPFQQRRHIVCADASGAVQWRHEIAAPVFLPPPP